MLLNMKVTVIPIAIGKPGTIRRALVKGLERLGNQEDEPNHPNYTTVEVNQNTKKSPGDLKWLADTQPPVNDHQLMQM